MYSIFAKHLQVVNMAIMSTIPIAINVSFHKAFMHSIPS